MNLQLLNSIVLFHTIGNAVSNFVKNGDAAPTGLSLLLQTSLLLAFGLLALTVTRRRNPHLQTLICRALIIGVALCTLFAFQLTGSVRPALNIALPTAPRWVNALSTPPVASAPRPPNAAGTADAASGEPIKSGAFVAPPPRQPALAASGAMQLDVVGAVYRGFLILWSTVAISLLVWLGLCHLYILRLRLTSKKISDGRAFDLLHQLWDGHRSHAPALLANPGVSSPLLCGLYRPAILLPATYERDYDETALRAILLHELAHRQRRDLWWSLFSRILCALLWPQPLMWGLFCRQQEISEQACDQAVINGGCSPQEYAVVLVNMAERLSPGRIERTVGASVVPFRSSLAQRVHRILSFKQRMARVSRRTRAAIICAVVTGATSVSLLVSVQAESQSTLDLSSPETTVRSFVSALNTRDATNFSQCVIGGQTPEDLVGFTENLKAWRVKLNILSMQRIPAKSSEAKITMLANVAGERQLYGSRILAYQEKARIELKRDSMRWLIVSRSMHLRNREDNRDALLPYINAIAPPELGKLKEWATGRGQATVSGRVMLDDGTPASRCRLHIIMDSRTAVFSDPTLWNAMVMGGVPPSIRDIEYRPFTTDENGYYSITGLTTAPYRISRHGGDGTSPDWILRNEPIVQGREGQATEAPDIKLIRAATIEVQLIDKKSSKPIPVALVSCQEGEKLVPGFRSVGGLSNEEGRATFHILPGVAVVTLRWGTGRSQKVLTTQTGAHYAITNASASLDGGRWASNNGVLKLTVAKGEKHRVVFRLNPTTISTPTRPYVEPTPEPTPDPRRQPRGTAVITGQVVYEDGQPASGVTVWALMQRKARWQIWKDVGVANTASAGEPYASRWKKIDGMVEAKAMTDASGNYRLSGLTTAPYNLVTASLSDKGAFFKAPPQGIAMAVEGVWAKAGRTVHRAQPLVLMRGTLIRGEVIDKTARQPLSGVLVACNGPQLPDTSDHVMYDTSDTHGKFTLHVAPGTTSLYIAGPAAVGEASYDVRHLYADTRKPATGGYAISTNRGDYSGMGNVEFTVDGGPLQYGLGFRDHIKLEVKQGQEKFLALHLRKLVAVKPASG